MKFFVLLFCLLFSFSSFAKGKNELDEKLKAKLLANKKMEWEEKLERMRTVYNRTLLFKTEYDRPEDIKNRWEKFLEEFKEDNPYSTEDEMIREKARNHISEIEDN